MIFGEREAARGSTVEKPGDVGDAGARVVDVVLHRAHGVGGEDGDVELDR